MVPQAHRCRCGLELHLICGNYAAHKTEAPRNGCYATLLPPAPTPRQRIVDHLVERWFAALTARSCAAPRTIA
jgi:hypothetical protein